jgi:hypothetical protein
MIEATTHFETAMVGILWLTFLMHPF